MKSILKYLLATWVLAITACNKFVEVPPPPNAVLSAQVFGNDTKATAAVNGIYSYMMNPSPTFSNWMATVYTAASADELLRFSPSASDEQFMTNQLLPANDNNGRIWTTLYKVVYMSNIAIEGLGASTGVTAALKNQLLGECLFLRAFSYFYLLNLYGDVPLLLGSDYQVNQSAARTKATDVYNQILDDLLKAKELVAEKYPSAGKGRPNKWAVTAMLARVYLYGGSWSKAEQAATEVIATNLYGPLEAPRKVFLANSKEAIWQLVPDPGKLGYIPELVNAGYYPTPAPQFYLQYSFVSSFEPGDLRRNLWLDSLEYSGKRYYYPGKYKDISFTNAEFYMVLRLGEQYLIRAETRAAQGNIATALEDLNIIRKRAGLAALAGSFTKEQALAAVEQERKSELFAEWGHRWFDLKRTGRADVVLSAIKGAGWQHTDLLWPIPQAEMTANSKLEQNPGY